MNQYVLIPQNTRQMVYGLFPTWDAAEDFAILHGLVATHRPMPLHSPAEVF